jgi:hypothetical protein
MPRNNYALNVTGGSAGPVPSAGIEKPNQSKKLDRTDLVKIIDINKFGSKFKIRFKKSKIDWFC